MNVLGNISKASGLTKQVMDYVQTVKDGGNERSKLLSEVSSLSAFLSVLDDSVKAHVADQNPSLAAILAPDGPLDHSMKVLHDLESKLKPVGGHRGLRKTLKWPMERGEVIDKLAEIERLKSLIMLVLMSSPTYVSCFFPKNLRVFVSPA